MLNDYIAENNKLKNKLEKYIELDKTNTLKYMFVNAIKSIKQCNKIYETAGRLYNPGIPLIIDTIAYKVINMLPLDKLDCECIEEIKNIKTITPEHIS